MVSLPKIDKILPPIQGHLVLEYEKNRPSGLGGVCEHADRHAYRRPYSINNMMPADGPQG